jgi:hypothetical protein
MNNVSELTRDIRQGRSARYIRRVYGDLLKELKIDLRKNHSWKERYQNLANIESAINGSVEGIEPNLEYLDGFREQLERIDYKLVFRSKFGNEIYGSLESLASRTKTSLGHIRANRALAQSGRTLLDILPSLVDHDRPESRLEQTVANPAYEVPIDDSVLEIPSVAVYDDEEVSTVVIPRRTVIIPESYVPPAFLLKIDSSKQKRNYFSGLQRALTFGLVALIPFISTCQYSTLLNNVSVEYFEADPAVEMLGESVAKSSLVDNNFYLKPKAVDSRVEVVDE